MAGPDAARGAQLGDLLEEIVVDVPEIREPAGEVVDVEPASESALDVGEAVGKRERQLLRGRRSRFADVVAADRDRVPLWRVRRAPLEAVDDQTQRGLDGKAPGVLRHVLLQNVVLNRALQLVARYALLFGGGDVEGPEDDRGPVDRHRRRDLVERNAREQVFHVLEARDRDTALPPFAVGSGVIRVVAHQRRKVERDGEARCSVREEELVALVRLARGPEAGELAHRPQLSAVAGRVNAAGEGELAGDAECLRAFGRNVELRVEGLDFAGRVGEGNVAKLALLVLSAPGGNFGAQAFEFSWTLPRAKRGVCITAGLGGLPG